MSEADKKDPSKIQEELKREFEKENQDIELAVHELSNRKRVCDESAQTFAYKIEQLVKLAYPSFNDEARQTIAKDCFVKDLHHEMQIALKSSPKFSTASLIDLAKETSRLQIAGIQSVASSKQGYCMSVETNHYVDSVVDKVLEKIKGLAVGIPEGAQAPPSVEFVDNKPVGRFTNREMRKFTQEMKILNSKSYRNVILGRDFLSKFSNVQSDFKKQRVKLCPHWHYCVQLKKPSAVHLTESIELPARTESVVNVKCRPSIALITADFEPFPVAPGIYATHCRVIPSIRVVFQIKL